MEELKAPFSRLPRRATYHSGAKLEAANRHQLTLPGIKKRGQGSRSWIQIDQDGNSQIVALDKASVMKKCNLPARDLRLLDPLFVYPSTLLGREKAIVVSLEHIRCIIMADEVILMNSMDGIVLQYESELCRRLKTRTDQSDDLPFEFRALELALELACMSLDSQVTELEIEVYPVLEKLASSISTLDLEHVRRLKSNLLSLTRRVQKVRDEIEHLMDDDGDMAEMYLTEKKVRMEAYSSSDPYCQSYSSVPTVVSKSAPVSPVGSMGESYKLERTSSKSSSKHGSFRSSSNSTEHIEELEMLLEAYFVVIDNTLSKLLSLKEFIDDTEDFINIKLSRIMFGTS
ncbi:magnesium transporter MRS2-5 isoform X2 [Aristolochia californica]|uniref:magnesium transporter MRS2-5 isoform X2 n=1 Tax=Aristolochia californica TaxID=171875 RepID=UPI0035D5DE33